MMDVAKAHSNHLANIEKRYGKSLDELSKFVKASGHTKHGEIRDHLKHKLGMGHGDANAIAHYVLQTSSFAATIGDAPADDIVIGSIYSGPKETLRPIHDKLMKAIDKFGPFEIAPKKGYVSLRRKKQFAMIGPATNTRVEVGLNMKGAKATKRLEAMPAKSMCQYKVKLTDVKEVDAELIAWIKTAFDATG
jgi:hypothetical protein